MTNKKYLLKLVRHMNRTFTKIERNLRIIERQAREVKATLAKRKAKKRKAKR